MILVTGGQDRGGLVAQLESGGGRLDRGWGKEEQGPGRESQQMNQGLTRGRAMSERC